MNHNFSREEMLKLMELPPKKLREELVSHLNYSTFDEDDCYFGTRYTMAKLAYKAGLLDEMRDFVYEFLDSLPERLEKALIYMILGRAYLLEENLVMANSFFVKVLYITDEEQYSGLDARIYLYLTYICIKIDEFHRALYYLSRIDINHERVRKHHKIDVAIHKAYALGMLKTTQHNVDELIKIYQEYGDEMLPKQKSLVFEYIGNLYYVMDNDRMALEKYNASAEISVDFKTVEGRYRYAITSYKIAQIQYKLKLYKEAVVNAEAAYKNFFNHKNKLYLEKAGLMQLRCLFALKRFDEAYSFFSSESTRGFTTREVVNVNMAKIIDTFKDSILLRKDLAENIKRLDEYNNDTVQIDNEIARLKGGTHKFRLLNEFLVELIEVDDEEVLYNLAYQYISEMLMFKVFYIACLDVNDFNINFDYRNALLGTHDKHSVRFNSNSIVSQIIRNQKTVVINSIADFATGAVGLYYNNQEIEDNSHIFVPLVNEEKTFGVVSVQIEEKNYYTEIDVELLETFAEILASAITLIRKNREISHKKQISLRLSEELKQKNTRLLKIGQYDELTGLFNRNGLADKVNQILLSSSLPIDISVIMLDIDRFKLFNDSYGHIMGDEYLKELSLLITSTFGPKEAIVARFGGEEFIIIIPYSKDLVLLDRAENMRKKIIEYGQELSLCVATSISMGVVSGLMNTREDLEALIAHSDELLYKAKMTGRNKICTEWDFKKR